MNRIADGLDQIAMNEKTHEHIAARVVRSKTDGEFLLFGRKASDLRQFSEKIDPLPMLKCVEQMTAKLYFSTEDGKHMAMKLRPCFELRGHIANHQFRYFGVCLISSSGNVLCSTTIWCNNKVREAANSSDADFRAILLQRKFFTHNPELSILSVKGLNRGIMVTDPVTGNVNMCNCICLVN